ncbi:MAG: hypothetical protein EOP85_02755 [Verrucomicrobiaceae bacterium]|nr:MAG: hypothetical protein EOP85_02755 [Verrucomicrobiaceae bacterium]
MKSIHASLFLIALGSVDPMVAQDAQTVPPAFEKSSGTTAEKAEEGSFIPDKAAPTGAEIVTVAHPGQSFKVSDTVVWSPLFQATWEKLTTVAGGLPVVTTPPNKLMEDLDSFRWEPARVMPEGSWQAWGGPATNDFLKQVNKEAAAITGEPEGPFVLKDESPRKFAAFGLLDRTVEFQRAFFRSTKAPMNFRTSGGEIPVAFFGIRGLGSDYYRESVRVLAWRPKDSSHAIEIRCKQDNETVILYHPPVGQDFTTACLWLRTWRSRFNPDAASYGVWDDNRLHQEDEIRIPYVSLESKSDLEPLFKGVRTPEKGMPWIIDRAEQVTKFQLHEKGARVRAEVSTEADPFGLPPPVVPRQFLYDRPFFVFLWKDEAEWPYFGCWIGDASVLRKFEP